MESRKKRLGPSKFGVWYENQRASWQSERTLASWLSRHSGLSWNSGVLMKTSEGISFSIAHLSRLKQLRCKPGQKLPWFVDEKPPNGQTYLSPRSLVVPHWKHGLRKTRCSCDHVSFLLDPDWSWEDPGDFVTPWSDKDSLLKSSHKLLTRFFPPDI